MAAELAEEQRVWSGACRCGDVHSNLAAAANPVMDVVAQVGSQITAVWQDVQRNAREGKEGGDFLQEKVTVHAGTYDYLENSGLHIFGA